jgi:hypothetical protein
MFTIILMLYLQQNLNVALDSATPRGHFASMAECERAAARLRGPLPTPHGYAAAWNDALCVPIQRNASVNDLPPTSLDRLLRERPAPGCQSEGAWRRMAEQCQKPG